MSVLSDVALRINSFTLTSTSLSISFSKDVEPRRLVTTIGIDRNLRNLAVGNDERITSYDMKKIVEVGESTRSIVGSFKRNDVRTRRLLSSKYGRRRSERVRQIIHGVTKQIVREAMENNQAIVFEEIRGIRNLYRRGNGQGRSFGARMNSWPFHEVKRQVEYKAAWEGVPVLRCQGRKRKGPQWTARDAGRDSNRQPAATKNIIANCGVESAGDGWTGTSWPS